MKWRHSGVRANRDSARHPRHSRRVLARLRGSVAPRGPTCEFHSRGDYATDSAGCWGSFPRTQVPVTLRDRPHVSGRSVQFSKGEKEMTNLNRRSWLPADDERLRKLAAAGASLTEIATQMGRGVSSVRSRSLNLGIAIARDRNPMIPVAWSRSV